MTVKRLRMGPRSSWLKALFWRVVAQDDDLFRTKALKTSSLDLTRKGIYRPISSTLMLLGRSLATILQWRRLLGVGSHPTTC